MVDVADISNPRKKPCCLCNKLATMSYCTLYIQPKGSLSKPPAGQATHASLLIYCTLYTQPKGSSSWPVWMPVSEVYISRPTGPGCPS